MVLRSSKSCCTVSFSKPVTKMFRAFSKSFLSASRSFCLSDFFFMIDSPSQLLRVEYRHIQVDARPHGGADGDALDVFPFRRRRFGFDYSLDQAGGVFAEFWRRGICLCFPGRTGVVVGGG